MRTIKKDIVLICFFLNNEDNGEADVLTQLAEKTKITQING